MPRRDGVVTGARTHDSVPPEPYVTDEVTVSVKARPLERVGGDHCRGSQIGDHRLTLCMCDAVGHGIASTLLNDADIETFVPRHVQCSDHPCTPLQSLNEFLLRRLPSAQSCWRPDPLPSETHPPGLSRPPLLARALHRRSIRSGGRTAIHSDGMVDRRGEAKPPSALDTGAQLVHGHRTLSANALNATLIDETDRLSIGQRPNDRLPVTLDMP